MKNIIAITLTLIMAFGLAACATTGTDTTASDALRFRINRSRIS